MVDIKPQAAQERFLQHDADILIYGGEAGGGKSFGLLLDHIRWAGVKNYTGVIFRRTFPELVGAGSLWEEAIELFPHVGGIMRWGARNCRFPLGGLVEFRHMQYEHDKTSHQGKQYAVISFDELTHFTDTQFWYLVSRNRSRCGVKPYVRGTCNPDADSWLAEFLAWWIDQDTGYAIPERSGVKRWMAREGDRIHWGSSPEDVADFITDADAPLSVSFIHATLEDNPALTARDPGYRSRLKALPALERMRLLGGNWKIRSSEGVEWPWHLWDEVWPDYWPDKFDGGVIAVDPSRGKDPDKGDYSAVVFLGVSGGQLWVDARIERVPVEIIVRNVVEMFVEYNPVAVGVEAAMNQDLVFMPSIQQYATEQYGLATLPLWNLDADGQKEKRIFRLNPLVVGKTLRFRPGQTGTERLLSQMQGFPRRTVHDDGPDALEMAYRLMQTVITQNVHMEEEVEEWA